MNEELERLIEDRNEAESDLYDLEERLNRLEDDPDEDHQDHDEWNYLYHECCELTNHISYLTSLISSYEEEGEF